MPNGTGGRAGYDPIFFGELARVEDRHFWFRFRNQVIANIAADVAGSRPGVRVLEVGCGNGNVLRFLSSTLRTELLVGVDLFVEGLRLARTRSSAHLVCGDVHNSPFGCNFDLIGAFDVIEHLADDLQALRDLRRLIADDGVLLLTVPARMSLWSYFDEASGHCRRYSRKELERTLGACGFRVEYATEFMMALYPLIWLGRRLSGWNARRSDASSLPDLRVVPILNSLLLLALRWEMPLLQRRIRIPFGSSLLVIAKATA